MAAESQALSKDKQEQLCKVEIDSDKYSNYFQARNKKENEADAEF